MCADEEVPGLSLEEASVVACWLGPSQGLGVFLLLFLGPSVSSDFLFLLFVLTMVHVDVPASVEEEPLMV